MYRAQKKLAKDLWEAVNNNVNNNDVIKVRSLLGRGADPNHQLYWSDEWNEDPPLHWACRWGLLEIVKMLVTHGARTDKGAGRNNMIPLHAHGARTVKGAGRNNITPLHYACYGGHKEVVKYLIQEVGCSTGKYRIFYLR